MSQSETELLCAQLLATINKNRPIKTQSVMLALAQTVAILLSEILPHDEAQQNELLQLHKENTFDFLSQLRAKTHSYGEYFQ
jgi:hypothetical protein